MNKIYIVFLLTDIRIFGQIIKKYEVLRKNYLHHVMNEKLFLSAIRNPFIVHMVYYAHDICNLYFVMPFAVGGDMFGMIQMTGRINEFNAKFYSGQIVLALEYLHFMDIVYR